MDREIEEKLRLISSEISACRRCPLHRNRNRAVPGEGGFRRKILLIGEAPGAEEDRTGRPFAGRAGEVLDHLLASAGLSREDVFITSVLKCRPPKNRDPKPEELEACRAWLDRQVEILRPRIIVPMGRFALKYVSARYFISFGKIGDVHGKVFTVKDKWGPVRIVPVYHPAAFLYRPDRLGVGERDMGVVGKIDV